MIKAGNKMKRKYDCSKVRIGDWVYFCNASRSCETKYSYKVVKTDAISLCGEHMITVEIGNKKDDFVVGWPDSHIGNARYWNVVFWTKTKKDYLLMEIE